jgi:hypothetical protein
MFQKLKQRGIYQNERSGEKAAPDGEKIRDVGGDQKNTAKNTGWIITQP